ncbi:DUF397 domain-containing protein [Streptomyces sp. NPDC102406]|uniref:DUF397 domain-containing protein n=1 Tax=Streptomyces sp. NPDC102406 TaxID=3366171 RepID=UPI0037F86352
MSDALWFKSSFSNGDGGDCVEVARDFPGAAHWRKSSHSNGDGGNCVEIAEGTPGIVPVRDSKNPDGPAMIVGAPAWVPFIASLRGKGPSA